MISIEKFKTWSSAVAKQYACMGCVYKIMWNLCVCSYMYFVLDHSYNNTFLDLVHGLTFQTSVEMGGSLSTAILFL